VHRRRLILLPLGAVLAVAGFALITGSAAAGRDRAQRVPISKIRPRISGTAQVGQILHAHAGRWLGAARFAYRWEVCNVRVKRCKLLEGPKHRPYARSTYRLTAKDFGHRMRLEVIAANRLGQHAAWSRATAKIAKAGSNTFAPIAPTGSVPGSGAGSGAGSGSGGGSGSGAVPLNLPTGQSVGFYLGWDSSASPSQIPWNAVTQVDLFALQTTAGSGLDYSQLDAVSSVPNWVATVHAHHRLAIITIGGISDQHWDSACDSTNRTAFVANLISYMVTNGFDGVDLDVEQDNWGSQQAPVAAWDTCVQAITTAAHAAKTQAGNIPLVSTDIDQTWMAPYVAGFASYPDQFNLMGYSNSCDTTCMASQVQDMLTEGKVSSPTKLTMGMDVDAGDTGATVTPSQCGSIAAYAAGAGLGGVMVWTLQGDEEAHGGQFQCMSQLAPYVAQAP
jgi:hypothetical protein